MILRNNVSRRSIVPRRTMVRNYVRRRSIVSRRTKVRNYVRRDVDNRSESQINSQSCMVSKLILSIYTIIRHKSVDVRKLQVAILARSPREMSQTDRILPRYILSRVRVSVRPRLFVIREQTANHSRPARRSRSPLCGR